MIPFNYSQFAANPKGWKLVTSHEKPEPIEFLKATARYIIGVHDEEPIDWDLQGRHSANPSVWDLQMIQVSEEPTAEEFAEWLDKKQESNYIKSQLEIFKQERAAR